VVALVAGTWAVSEKFSDVKEDLRNAVEPLNDSIRALRASIVKLDASANKSEEATLTESAITSNPSPASTPLTDLCTENATDDNTVVVGQTVVDSLSQTDDQMEDETYFDTWILPVCEGGQIVIEMTSEELDPFLILYSFPELNQLAEDDDGGTGLNARMTADLDMGIYVIVVNTASVLVGQRTGRYTLRIQR